ncbi:tagatose-bisphosphate aldolase [Cellulomonas hominis]|uniref:D-tagatose-1,6-bisphosphate aldolase subunit GatZ/KbaZ n=1 Tax=Cellulomonas hominis TaxID=156981 RepID=A0A511F7M8_9CELL|nr:D-tagatose-bisphosphate aldolase, class II, non-catalytic subunit [Cellulomonas hominis]MBB5473483.1 D-tagatose-1,6-bisphosphate aldolase subunit GatZ/KbaZ [Cellulomonas hominis]GEL45235.1 tagatose-bisphosphate aldolase [Cellulomonas hominis]
MTDQPAPDQLSALVTRHRAGSPEGIYSVCSAHPLVLEAAVRQALADGSWLLVEATSNQVDQFGGYTGMTPADFRDLVHGITDRLGLPRERLVLGGDHLGPNRWQDRPADEAMDLAEGVIEAYVAAGYTKIHLDCSMSCADDPTPLGDAAVAQRAARLLAVAERTAARTGTPDRLSYVIGTEVPVPGGAHETLHALTPTSPEAARATIAAHRAALGAVGMLDAWPRVRALVVQPAVEFDHVQVVDYRSEATVALREVLADEPGMVFEAHSTDYQTTERLTALVRDHWAVLKVGPGLTFALREALFALAEIETELVPDDARSHLLDVLDARMVAQPRYWQGYHDGDPAEQRVARRYSYSDRVRYYWPDPEVEAAVETLLGNLARTGIPETLLSQHLPEQYARVRAGALSAEPRELVVDKVRDALRPYAAACFPTLVPSA